MISANFKIAGIGEVLWDLLPDGPQPGGAPANFAWHAQALGGQARIVTRIGNDAFGRNTLKRFKKSGIPIDTLQVDDDAPTGTVTVSLSGDGVPHFTIHEKVAWDKLEVTDQALNVIRAADAICFGTLAQRTAQGRTSIQHLVAAAPADALRVFDVNLRQHYYSREIIEQSLKLASVLKLNDGELAAFAGMFRLAGSVRRQIERLAHKFGLQLVALTRGAAGSLLHSAGQWSDCSSVPIEVVDTVGAGDAFTAALVLGLLQKMPLDEVNSVANEVARYVCSRAGAMPPLPKRFRERFTG